MIIDVEKMIKQSVEKFNFASEIDRIVGDALRNLIYDIVGEFISGLRKSKKLSEHIEGFLAQKIEEITRGEEKK